MLARVNLPFSLGGVKYIMTSLHHAQLYKSGVGSEGEMPMISLAASQGKDLLFKAPNVCLLLSTDPNFYRYQLMASEDLGA